MTRNEEIEIKSFKVYPVNKDYYEDEYGHSGYVDNNRHAREAFVKGAVWADEHPKSGLIDVDAACLWLIDSLKAHNLMSTTAIEYFVGGFKNFCEIRNKELWQEKKM